MTKETILPRHIAIIPDGNRRWAKQRGLKPWQGHQEAAKRIEEIVEAAVGLKIKYFTLWGGSYDNLTKRPKKEVLVLGQIYYQLTERLLKNKTVWQEGIRVRFLGEWPKLLDSKTVALMKRAETETKNHQNYHYTYLIGYNGDREMIEAINRLLGQGRRSVTPAQLKACLWTADLPEVDLIIRTGDEPHVSAGFMMWDARYAQLYFSPKMWPEFRKKDLIRAIKEYSQRERRLGA
jgi:undecaprenyl diphosphate synthase